jgi:enamine deaminase RidA (YjgF/YER057c/UK114 family)
MKRIRLAGQLVEPISHNTDGVEAHGFLYSLGMLPTDAAGELVGVGDAFRQSEQVLDNVGAPLTAAGASFDDVVRVAVYVRHVTKREPINMVRRCYFGDSRPASTLVAVSALAHPAALVKSRRSPPWPTGANRCPARTINQP